MLDVVDHVGNRVGRKCQEIRITASQSGRWTLGGRRSRGLMIDPRTLHEMAKQAAYGRMRKAGEKQQIDMCNWKAHYFSGGEVKSYRVTRGTMKEALQYVFFEPLHEGVPPVLAFAGTDVTSVGDILTDLEPVGVGYTQLRKNKPDILKNVLKILGKVVRRNFLPSEVTDLVLTGHSLGGAMAQMAAIDLFPCAALVATYQSAGVPKRYADKFRANTSDKKPEVYHFMALGDIVCAVGEAMFPGTIELVGVQKFIPGWGKLQTDVGYIHPMSLLRPTKRKYSEILSFSKKDPYATYRPLFEKLRRQLGVTVRHLLSYYKQPFTEEGLLKFLGVSGKAAALVDVVLDKGLIRRANKLINELIKAIDVVLREATLLVDSLKVTKRGLTKDLTPIYRVKKTLQRTLVDVHKPLMDFDLEEISVAVIHSANTFLTRNPSQPFAKVAAKYSAKIHAYAAELSADGF